MLEQNSKYVHRSQGGGLTRFPGSPPITRVVGQTSFWASAIVDGDMILLLCLCVVALVRERWLLR